MSKITIHYLNPTVHDIMDGFHIDCAILKTSKHKGEPHENEY